jgi:hypothetical protein
MANNDDNLRFWYEHELCRVRAAERAGSNVAKEIATLMRQLNSVPTEAIRGDVTAAVKNDHCICQEQHRRGRCTEPGCPHAIDADDVLPTDWTKP